MSYGVISGVYQIKNRLTGDRYIGSSVNIGSRYCSHKSQLRRRTHVNTYLQNAWNKYGEDNFTFDVLLICPRDQTTIYEQAFLDKTEHKYNVSDNVDGKFMLGKKQTKEHIEKRIKHLRGKKLSKEHRIKLSENHADVKGENSPSYGKIHTEESKQKMSDVRKEWWENNADLKSQWVARLRNGHAPSDEHKRKISEALKGYQKTDEHRKRLSESAKKYWARKRGEM